jgi:ABC-2 type transport system permease protein
VRDRTGWPQLVRLLVRRDRVRLAIWLGSISGVVWLQAVSIEGLYGDDQEALVRAGELVANNPAFIAMAGPPLALDTLGGRTSFEISLFAMVLAALMNLFLVTRHLRAEEETGRAELLRAGAVGRHAPIVAVLAVALATDVVLSVLTAAGLLSVGLPVAGSWALAAGIAGVGLVFAGIAAVTSQLTVSTRAASGMAGAAVAVAFVLRAVGDIGNGVLSWTSPIGWGQALRPFADERWWPLLLLAGTAGGLTVGAFALANRRDLGAGLVHPSPGSASASAALLQPSGLALRLQRATVAAWVVSVFLGGVAYGSIGEDVDELIADNEVMQEIAAQVGGDLVDGFLATTSVTMALIAAGYAVQGTLRMRVEEQAGRVEPLLATALPRLRWARSHLSVVVVSSVLLLAAAGLGTGLAFGMATGDLDQVPRLIAASLVYAPAVLVVVGLAFALVGLAPRLAKAAWGALALWLVVGMLGQVLRLPDWVVDTSPFEHVPKLPAVPMSWMPVVVLTLVGAALVAAGAAGLQRRDVG